MKGFIIGFSLSILQALYYDHKRYKRQVEFNNKLIIYLKDKEKNLE
jgi:hypothetical protein